IVPEVRNPARSSIEFVGALAGGDPQIALPVFKKSTNSVIAEAEGIPGIMLIVHKISAGRVQAVQSRVSSNAQCAAAVLIRSLDPVIAQSRGLVGIKPVMANGIRGWVEPVQPSIRRADPHDTGAVDVQRKDGIITQAVRIVRIVLIGLQTIAVIPAQSAVS